MKTAFKYSITAFAAIAALVSCNKDNYTDGPAAGNVRVIEAFFGTATKSTLGGDEGMTPLFSDGDTIMVSNGTYKEVDTVRVDQSGNASFATSLTGALTAVYPSNAAKLNGNAIEGVIVPATQDGSFAKANIAKATIASDATSATFQNQTSLLRFYVDESIGVKSITITAGGESNIADGSKTITVDPEGDATLDSVTDDPERRICYVAVLPGTFSSLTFASETTTQTLYAANTVKRIAGNVTLAINKMYNAFIPYYIDLGTAGRWGYCNVGAFLPEDAGMYFAWGETKGHYPETDGEGAFAFGTGNGGFADDFSNCPYFGSFHSIQGEDMQYYDEPAFKKYMPAGDTSHWDGTGFPDNLTQIETCDDAATANWGEGWRMPRMTEFEALIELCSGSFDSGYRFGTAPCTIFLPSAGAGYCDALDTSDGTGIYWSSSLNTDEGDFQGPSNGNDLEFYTEDTPYIGCSGRYLGCSVRPYVAATANMPDPTETDQEVTVF